MTLCSLSAARKISKALQQGAPVVEIFDPSVIQDRSVQRIPDPSELERTSCLITLRMSVDEVFLRYAVC